MLGINGEDNLNVPGEDSDHFGETCDLILPPRRRLVQYDSITDGCICEGFAVSASVGANRFEFWGGANVDEAPWMGNG